MKIWTMSEDRILGIHQQYSGCEGIETNVARSEAIDDLGIFTDGGLDVVESCVSRMMSLALVVRGSLA